MHLDSKRLDQSPILDTGRTRGFATTAVEAQVEMAFHGVGQFQTSIRDGTHQVNPTAWTVIFITRFQIGGTRGGA